MFMTGEEGIKEVFGGPSHVVILGAGASIASHLDNPEPSGKKLPSMDDFIEIVGLGDLIDAEKAGGARGNFENLYSRLYTENPHSSVIAEIERRVHSYFSSMTLPPTPTIYDYLILALRPTDLVATFNWDPFLFDAFRRNRHMAKMPNLSFLHGSVSIAYSPETGRAAPAEWISGSTDGRYVPTRLLYPVSQKDYNQDAFIRGEWDRLRAWMKIAKRVTIFGYSAPDTDLAAMDLMSEAWGEASTRNLEQFEIIDICPKDVLRHRWNRLIYEGHYEFSTRYFESNLALFPRRTGESYMHQFLPKTSAEAMQETNPVPENFDTLEAMWEWHRPLIDAEKRHETKDP